MSFNLPFALSSRPFDHHLPVKTETSVFYSNALPHWGKVSVEREFKQDILQTQKTGHDGSLPDMRPCFSHHPKSSLNTENQYLLYLLIPHRSPSTILDIPSH